MTAIAIIFIVVVLVLLMSVLARNLKTPRSRRRRRQRQRLLPPPQWLPVRPPAALKCKAPMARLTWPRPTGCRQASTPMPGWRRATMPASALGWPPTCAAIEARTAGQELVIRQDGQVGRIVGGPSLAAGGNRHNRLVVSRTQGERHPGLGVANTSQIMVLEEAR